MKRTNFLCIPLVLYPKTNNEGCEKNVEVYWDENTHLFMRENFPPIKAGLYEL
jgi:hypothetical protein